MEKYCVIISKNYISVQKNNSELKKQNVLVFFWMIAYILQKISEEISCEETFQEDIEDFVFEINNANVPEDVIIPETIDNILLCLEKDIKNSDTINVEYEGIEIHLDQEELEEIFNKVIEDVIMSRLDDISGAEISLEVDGDFGEMFSNCVLESFRECDNNVKNGTTKTSISERQVYYGGKLLFESMKDYENVKKIEVDSEMREGIPFIIADERHETRKYVYLTFPFWNIGDVIEITVNLDEDVLFLKGRHKKTNILSCLKI